MSCNKLEITNNRTVIKWTLNNYEPLPVTSNIFSLNCSDCDFYLMLSGWKDDLDATKVSLIRKRSSSTNVCVIKSMEVSFSHNPSGNIAPKLLTMKATDTRVDVNFENYSNLFSTENIILYCNVGFISHDPSSKPSTISNQTLMDDFQILLDKALHSDIKLVSNGTEFMAHKAILSARSSVFEAMFNHDTKERKENSVAIDDLSADTVSQLLKYIYTGVVDKLSVDDYLSLFVAADKYAITKLKRLCSKILCSLLVSEMCLKVLAISHMHQDEDLSKAAMQSMQEKAVEIMESPEWLQFIKEYPEVARNVTLYIVKGALTS